MAPARRLVCLLALATALVAGVMPAPPSWSAAGSRGASQASQVGKIGAGPIEITADRVQYLQNTDVYEATGSVVIVQGPLRLTADRVTIFMLSGTLVASGNAHLTDATSDIRAERIDLDVNTEAGVLTEGTLFVKGSNSLVTGRLFQRFSEDHYRVKDGTFTNCDAGEGQVPAWRFRFKDVELDLGEQIYGNDVWLCVLDRPILPLPSISYPLETTRKSGFLVPNVGYDTFGLHLRESFYWAVNRSQDVTITPDYYSTRGYGSDLLYRYVLDKHSRGQWLMNVFQDNAVQRVRAFITGSHVQHVTPTLTIKADANLLSDRTVYNNLSSSGVLRALPSTESNLFVSQRLATGNLYFLGQYLQPLAAGSSQTFQRLPEIGYSLANYSPFGGPLVLGGQANAVYFYREQGFGYERVDFVPGFATDVLHAGHMVGLTPQFKFREVYYSRGVSTAQSVHRTTFWAGLEATTRLSRQYRADGGGSFLHTIEPNIFYEFVPATDQSQIIQVDAVDDLPKKNLVTYSLKSRLLEQLVGGGTSNWMDLTVAQSYHVSALQSQARFFPFPGSPLFISDAQQLQPQTVPVQGRRFSDVWTRAVFGNPVVSPLNPHPVSLSIDAFFDPYGVTVSQWNTDLRYQHEDQWYVQVGQRHTQSGNRPRRGDIWNPLSFAEVFAPTPELDYLTASAAIRLPLGWTVGARTYYDMQTGQRPETDIVGIYQNPCRCWSLGLFYIQFPDRVQYNFMISMTGVGGTESFGTQVMKTILGPLLGNERGLPWPSKMTVQPAAGSEPVGPR
jgi:LPS-assembly protein